MRIVGVPGEIIVTDQLDRGFHGGLVTPKTYADITAKILRWRPGEIFMFGVAAEFPMLLHALQPVRGPAAVALNVDDFELREFFKDTEPDQAGHGRHGLKRMG